MRRNGSGEWGPKCINKQNKKGVLHKLIMLMYHALGVKLTQASVLPAPQGISGPGWYQSFTALQSSDLRGECAGWLRLDVVSFSSISLMLFFSSMTYSDVSGSSRVGAVGSSKGQKKSYSTEYSHYPAMVPPVRGPVLMLTPLKRRFYDPYSRGPQPPGHGPVLVRGPLGTRLHSRR